MMRIFFVVIMCVAALSASAQQMVVLKKGNVISRFNLGDPIRYVTKDGLAHNAAILAIHEFEFVTLQKDTVKFSDVAKLKFKNKGTWTYIKSTLIGSAGLVALSYAVEPAFGDSNPNAIKGMRVAAVVGAASTLFILAMSRSQIKLNGFKRLKFINYDSPMYK